MPPPRPLIEIDQVGMTYRTESGPVEALRDISLAIFKKRVPEIDLTIIEPNMMLGLDLMRTKNYADKGIGWIDDKKMCGSVDLVNTYMGLAKKVDCKDVYTTEFLTKVAMPVAVK